MVVGVTRTLTPSLRDTISIISYALAGLRSGPCRSMPQVPWTQTGPQYPVLSQSSARMKPPGPSPICETSNYPL